MKERKNKEEKKAVRTHVLGTLPWRVGRVVTWGCGDGVPDPRKTIARRALAN
jgi:hypothetical protein